jgi:hypothetical protein
VPLRLRESAGAHVIASLEKRGSRLRSVEVVAGGFMPLRGADEEAVPPMLRSLNASDMTGEQRAPLRQLSGASLTTLSSAAKRRLLAAALEEPRRRALGIRADRESLLLYLSLGLPERRAVAVLPEWGVGVIERDGSGLAYVCAPDGRLRGSISSLRAHGSAAAEHELLDAIRTWVERGRPGPDQLVVGAHVDGPSMRLSWRWA